VIELLKVFADLLTDAERKKLAMATRRLR